jgi:hypothetical protein
LKTLDPVHYSGICEALGAFCTSDKKNCWQKRQYSQFELPRNTRVLRVEEMEKMDISSTQLGPVVTYYPDEKVRNKHGTIYTGRSVFVATIQSHHLDRWFIDGRKGWILYQEKNIRKLLYFHRGGMGQNF